MESTTIEYLARLLFGLVVAVPGFGALVVVLVNLGKAFKLVKDDQAPFFVNVLNVLFAIAIWALATFFPSVDLGGLDELFASVSGVLTTFLPALVILVRWFSGLFYPAIRGVPLIGHSHSK